MRTASTAVCLALIVVACGGGSLTLADYAAQAERLLTAVNMRVDTLDAELESKVPTVEGTRTYWDQRLEARDEFLEGLRALDPPDEAVELHGRVLELFGRLVAAEEALAARVDGFETATEPQQWWETEEGLTARAVDEETLAICRVAQAEFDRTAERGVLARVPWIPSELTEVVRVDFGCPE